VILLGDAIVLQNGIKYNEKYFMKQIKEFIIEKFKINSKNISKYNYYPKDRSELKKLIDKLIKKRGYNANLNDIDTSEITDMHSLFLCSRFNGDISEWNVSNVTDMKSMFRNSEFDGNLSKWNISNVKNTEMMFDGSKFTGKNGDISNWDIHNIENMKDIFNRCPLEKNPPKWYKD